MLKKPEIDQTIQGLFTALVVFVGAIVGHAFLQNGPYHLSMWIIVLGTIGSGLAAALFTKFVIIRILDRRQHSYESLEDLEKRFFQREKQEEGAGD